MLDFPSHHLLGGRPEKISQLWVVWGRAVALSRHHQFSALRMVGPDRSGAEIHAAFGRTGCTRHLNWSIAFPGSNLISKLDQALLLPRAL